MKYIASCSCGKDSLAMVYKLIEEGEPLNEIVFYDTGMEFQCIYDNWDKLNCYAEPLGIKCTTLYPKPGCEFLYKMFDKPVKYKDGSGIHYGYSWCGGTCRWGTSDKLNSIDKYCEAQGAYCYVGIAADESQRLVKERKPYKIFPLVRWNMREADCLTYCRSKGIAWLENNQNAKIDLYNILDRVSCWCCANKNMWELYNMWLYLPAYWNRLCNLQSRLERPFKRDSSILEIQKRFENGYIPRHRTRK